MEIYKFIENYKYEAKPNYIKLPKSSKIHLEHKSEEYGECWCIVLPKDFYNINYQNIFPKYSDYRSRWQLELGDYVFICIAGILSDNWKGMSDEDFYEWIDAYTNQFYIIENAVNRESYVKKIEASQWDCVTGSQFMDNVQFVQYTDDTKKSVNVHLYKTILTPVSVSKIIKIRMGFADILKMTWESDKQDDTIGEVWSIEKNKIQMNELLRGSNYNHECSITTDPTLFEKKKKYIIDNII